MIRLILPMLITAGLLAYGYSLPADDGEYSPDDVAAVNALVGSLDRPPSVRHHNRATMSPEQVNNAVAYLYGNN